MEEKKLYLIDKTKLSIDLDNLENLVISGGGVLGYSYIGIFKYLEENNLTNKINNVIGSSAGAIFGTLFSIGYNYTEFKTALLSINPSEYLNITVDSILTFGLNKGLDDGEKFITKFKELIAIKTLNPNITFIEHYKKFNIKLQIGVTNINKMIFEIMNYELTPDLPIYLAIKASVAIPCLYHPVLINNNYYLDGGISDNYPIKYCCNIKTNKIENNTLGIYLSNYNSNLSNCGIDNLSIGDFFDRILKSSGNEFMKKITKYCNNTLLIEIPPDLLTSFKFNVKLNELNQGIELGYIQMKYYLEDLLQKKTDNINKEKTNN